MKRFFGSDSALYRIMEMLMQLAITGLLFLLCSIPVVTAGASYAAMASLLLDLDQGGGRITAAFFFKEWKRMLKRATAVWVPGLLILVILGFNIRFCLTRLSGTMRSVGCGVYVLLFVLISGALLFFLILLSRTDFPLRDQLKNAGILALAKLPAAILMVLFTVSPMVLFLMPGAWVIRLLPIIVLFWFSSPALMCVRIVRRVAGKYFDLD